MIAPIELEKLEECRSLLEEIPLPRTCFLLSLTPQKKDPFWALGVGPFSNCSP